MIDIKGIGNIGLENILSSTISITQQIGKSSEYHELQERLKELQQHLARIPTEEVDERFEYSQKIADQRQLIEVFEKDVQTLAATFECIAINTARIKTAKEYFDSGAFTKARILLKTESSTMADDQVKLLAAKEQKTKELGRIQKQLKDNATEYLIYAQTLELDYSNPNRFDHTQEAYRKSINSFEFFENISAYGTFLFVHKQFPEAELLYHRLTTELKESLSSNERASALNSLAILLRNTNELSRAEEGYTEALESYRKLAEENPQKYLPDVAMTLNNLANLHSDINELSRAEEEYTEALEIRRKLAKENPLTYLPDVAMTLNNLAILHHDTHELSRAEE